MRIRKRKVPLPFHLLSPVPIPPSFFSSSDPDPTTAAPLVQLRHDASGSGTRTPIPTSDDNKAAAGACGGAADLGFNSTDHRPNRGGSYCHVGSDGIGSAHPISWEDGKEEFGIKRSINPNNVAAVTARTGSKCSSSSSDPEISGQPQKQQSAAAAASSSTSASHPPPAVVGAMSTWCKAYHHQDHVKNDDNNSKSSFFPPSRKRSSWASSPSPISSSFSSNFDMNRDPTTIMMSPNVDQQEIRPQGDQIHPESTKVVHADHIISGISEGGGVNSNDKKKRSSGGGSGRGGGGGGVLMEGSRCSRVNGRGWRCSQPTLVGYSLCEHHLGKGRMRSITSSGSPAQKPPRQLGTTTTTTTSSTTTTSPSIAPKTKPNPSLMMTSSASAVHPIYAADDAETDARTSKPIGRVVASSSSGVSHEEGGEGEKKVVMIKAQFAFPTKKKSKLGTVKARSISSLLDQPDNNHNNSVIALLDRR